MNRIIIKGRLTATPELRTTQSGVETCLFTVAVDRYAGKDKERATDFIPCRAWRATAAFVSLYFTKGKEILVEGAMNIDEYEKDGEKRKYTYINVGSVEFCGSKSDAGQSAAAAQNTAVGTQEPIDDDLPF